MEGVQYTLGTACWGRNVIALLMLPMEFELLKKLNKNFETA